MPLKMSCEWPLLLPLLSKNDINKEKRKKVFWPGFGFKAAHAQGVMGVKIMAWIKWSDLKGFV